MKVAYVTTQFPSPSETFACNDVRKLHEFGLDVSVYAQRARHKNYKKMILERSISDVPIVTCGFKETLIGFLYIFLYFPVALKLLFWLISCDKDKLKHLVKCLVLIPASFYIFKKLEHEKPDVVHLFWGHYPSIVGFLVAQRLPHTRLTMFLGAYDLEMQLGISVSLAKDVSQIFTHALANLPQLKEMGISPGRVKVVYRGLDLGLASDDTRLDVIKEDCSIITASRLVSEKRVNKVIELMSYFPDFYLRVAGDGPVYNDLKKITEDIGVEDRVVFLGFVSQKNLFCYLTKAKIFIMLSNKGGERLPNVVKEAMLARCVCIVSNTPGINELITHGKTGFIISTDATSGEIFRLINSLDQDKLTQVGDAARNHVCEHFDLEASMKKYLKVWCSNV